MVGFLYIGAMALAATCVSVLGAGFSVVGLMRLFSGAAFAVAMMASALEFAKLVTAAFVHRTWPKLNFLYKTYLITAIVILSAITSMGIFGFLSDAYQSASKDLAADEIKITALKGEQTRNENEIARINKNIDEIPANRPTRKFKARQEAEPLIRDLTLKQEKIAKELEQASVKNLDVKAKVGPLVYVARVLNQDVDTIVKWLILVFVSVFDPLAICLVIGTSEAIRLNSLGFFKSVAHPHAPVQEQPKPQQAEPEIQTIQEEQQPVEEEGSRVRMRFAAEESTAPSPEAPDEAA